MKAWAEDHPKAKLMARKRSAILAAARSSFLRQGYDGVSMEQIAEAASVSIMTLYRHARNKDDLFSAVVIESCGSARDGYKAEAAKLSHLPLEEMLTAVGQRFQDKLLSRESVSLLRAVMVESERLPELAQAAYRGFIEDWEQNLSGILAERPDCAGLAAAARRKLVAAFFDSLVGSDLLRALLNQRLFHAAERKNRAQAAALKLTRHLPGTKG